MRFVLEAHVILFHFLVAVVEEDHCFTQWVDQEVA